MRVVCFYTELAPAAEAALAAFAPDAELVHTPADDIWAMGRELRARWTGEDDLVVIEGDKEIHAGVLPSFTACGRDWCSFGSLTSGPGTRYTNIGLGCARFAASVQRAVTAAALQTRDNPAWPLCHLCGGAGCWRYLDIRVATVLFRRAYILHDHGEIAHHHPRLKILEPGGQR